MSVSLIEFQTCRVHISDDVKVSDGKCCHACTVLVRFNPHRSINDGQCLEGDWTEGIEREASRRRAKSKVYKNCCSRELFLPQNDEM